MEASSPSRTRAFISYSQKDRKYLEELQIHLKPFERSLPLLLWDDTRIKPGAKRREKIKSAIQTARVAILLISADFLASDFIVESVLPPLLRAAEQEGATILPVLVGKCLFEETDLAQFQTVNDPSKPLRGMNPSKRDEVWVKVAKIVIVKLIRDTLKVQKLHHMPAETQEF